MKNLNNDRTELVPVMASQSLIGFTNPALLDFFSNIVKSIAQATRNAGKYAWQTIQKFAGWINTKYQEGVETHNQEIRNIDEFYARHWFHIRSIH